MILPILGPLGGSLLAGGIDAGFGILGGLSQARAQQQDYVNQLAFQNANSVFARWQAGFNKRVTDANSQYNYWQETVNHSQNLAYSRSLRNYEITKAVEQADVVAQTRSAAGADFIRTSEAIGQAMSERSMADAVALQQYTVAALKARSTAKASAQGQEGRSIDRLIDDYARQVGDYQTLQQINAGLQARQYTRQQAGALAGYLNAYNSQPFYEAQPYMDPIAPFMPLPALLEPAAPTYTGARPSAAAAGLNIGTSLMGAFGTGFSTYNQLRSFTNSGKIGAAAVGRS